MPSTSAKKLKKGKQKIKEEEDQHEVEKEFELIHIDSDEENESRISSLLLQNKNAQIKDLQANLDRAKCVNNVLEMENRQLGAQSAIYEAREIRARKEAQRAHVKLEEFMGTYEESEDEEGQSRRRPRTMGLKKVLARKREQESALAEQLSLSELLSMEIEYYWEP